MSKIEQVISEMEDFIDSCKLQPLSNSKILVNKAELEAYIDELKENVPDEIKKYQRIIANRDAILKDAETKAEEMIKKANEMTVQLVSEHEIMQQAYKEAGIVLEDANNEAAEIMETARRESNELKSATNQYLDDALATIQNILNSSISEFNVKYDSLLRSMEASLDITVQNRKAYHESQLEVERQQAEAARLDAEREAAIAEAQARAMQEAEARVPVYDSYGELSGEASVGDAMEQLDDELRDEELRLI